MHNFTLLSPSPPCGTRPLRHAQVFETPALPPIERNFKFHLLASDVEQTPPPLLHAQVFETPASFCIVQELCTGGTVRPPLH